MIRPTSCPLRFSVFMSSMVLTSTVVTAAAAGAQPLPIAVLDFATDGKELAATGRDLTELLVAGLSSAPDLVLVERARLDDVLSEPPVLPVIGPGSVCPDGGFVGIGPCLGGWPQSFPGSDRSIAHWGTYPPERTVDW